MWRMPCDPLSIFSYRPGSLKCQKWRRTCLMFTNSQYLNRANIVWSGLCITQDAGEMNGDGSPGLSLPDITPLDLQSYGRQQLNEVYDWRMDPSEVPLSMPLGTLTTRISHPTYTMALLHSTMSSQPTHYMRGCTLHGVTGSASHPG